MRGLVCIEQTLVVDDDVNVSKFDQDIESVDQKSCSSARMEVAAEVIITVGKCVNDIVVRGVVMDIVSQCRKTLSLFFETHGMKGSTTDHDHEHLEHRI